MSVTSIPLPAFVQKAKAKPRGKRKIPWFNWLLLMGFLFCGVFWWYVAKPMGFLNFATFMTVFLVVLGVLVYAYHDLKKLG